MSENPRISHPNLHRLREIGWRLWDPLGLLETLGAPSQPWDSPANADFADEYDSYLISAAAALRRGEAPARVVAFLTEVETLHMALSEIPTTRPRAEAVVRAILADPDLSSPKG